MAQNTDKFIKVKRRFATTIGSGGLSQGANFFRISNGSGLDTDTAIVLVINPGTDNEEVVKGVYLGDNEVGGVLRGRTGTTDQSHSPGDDVVMYWEEEHVDSMVDGLLVEHNQDGSHKDFEVNSVTADLMIEILEKVYPVGAIYISANSDNPETIFNFGTWERIQGRFIAGVDDEDSDFSSDQEGGHKELQQHSHGSGSLSTNSAGAHQHSVTAYNGGSIDGGGGNLLRNQFNTPSSTSTKSINTAGNHSHSISGSTSNTGSGDSQNLPPYVAKYIWQRVA